MIIIKEKIQEKISRTEKKLTELSIQTDRLHQDYLNLVNELGLTSAELRHFIENRENFDSSMWDLLEAEKRKLDEKLNLELNNVIDVNKTKQTMSEKGKVQQHWLFIR